jgi:hypothetical protein
MGLLQPVFREVSAIGAQMCSAVFKYELDGSGLTGGGDLPPVFRLSGGAGGNHAFLRIRPE